MFSKCLKKKLCKKRRFTTSRQNMQEKWLCSLEGKKIMIEEVSGEELQNTGKKAPGESKKLKREFNTKKLSRVPILKGRKV